MTLPRLRVGQIWQCRTQRVYVKILDIDEDAGSAFVSFIQHGQRWGGRHSIPFKTTETKGVYSWTGSASYDLMVLLYDPS